MLVKTRIRNAIDRCFHALLGPATKRQSERVILAVAIISYLVHLLLIVSGKAGFISLPSKFFINPIAAIYTPFSFILVYEVYLLVFYLSKSISYYICIQYEIITLIVIRRIFKDMAYLELTPNWFSSVYDLQFTFDVLTSVILFLLICFFYKSISRKPAVAGEVVVAAASDKDTFVYLKKGLATLLVPILLALALYTLVQWGITTLADLKKGVAAFENINNIFFDEFFTVLIVVDVLLLLASFFYSDEFHKIIRNSGFVISTILIKVSFSVQGMVNNALIIGAVLFGFLVLIIHNQFERKLPANESTAL